MLIFFKSLNISQKHVVEHKITLYLCTVFFMVLDLRLTKRLGCRETTFLVFIHSMLPHIY